MPTPPFDVTVAIFGVTNDEGTPAPVTLPANPYGITIADALAMNAIGALAVLVDSEPIGEIGLTVFHALIGGPSTVGATADCQFATAPVTEENPTGRGFYVMQRQSASALASVVAWIEGHGQDPEAE